MKTINLEITHNISLFGEFPKKKLQEQLPELGMSMTQVSPNMYRVFLSFQAPERRTNETIFELGMLIQQLLIK